MADAPADLDELIQQFCSLTGTSPHEAEQYLATNQWDLSSAAAEYFTSQEEGINEAQADLEDEPSAKPENPQGSAQGGARTLGGGPVPPQAIPTTSSAPPPSSGSGAKGKSTKKFATLGDLSRDQSHSHGHSGHGHDDDDDDDDSDSKDDPQDFFAGGEKSGLAVQKPPSDPRDQVRNIIAKAKKGIPRPGGEDAVGPSSRFTGTARTLGGDDAPSEVIPDPNATTPQVTGPVTRVLHLWRDGFSVDDGPLFRFDDPANADHLRLINQGRAPLSIMNVENNQSVDVQVSPHQEDYVQPKKSYKPFSGGGQRLGSPTPSARGSSSNQPTVSTGIASATTSTSSAAGPAIVDVNDSEPTLSLQIRLGDGTRLVSRFNTTHTIGDVYSFVNASSPVSTTRAWVLMTTFPSKELSDKAVVLGDLSEFKRGGVVLQKWQ
ncbi:MAG: hypothetical protein M1827_000153 [Pycnora praestabilis]|nr:MAG: hypothetical protein M1827_000153 [Pycnora praestabilis]